jgi:hypothetical protein
MRDITNVTIIAGDWVLFAHKHGLGYGKVIASGAHELRIIPIRKNFVGDYYVGSIVTLVKTQTYVISYVPENVKNLARTHSRYKEYFNE